MIRTVSLCLLILSAIPCGARQGETPPANPIDNAIEAALKAKGIEPAERCSDGVFVRRAFLDVIGTLPDANEVRTFLADTRADKRSALIDTLLARPEFADYWSLKWCDALRVKSEFSINLWPNAVQAYHRWVHEAVKTNMPYDRFARALLTSSGSNFRDPPANFCRAVQSRTPAGIAAAAALTFMGTRLDLRPKEEAARMEVFFSRVAFKGTAEWKEEIVLLNPAPAADVEAVFPDGSKRIIKSDEDPRMVFADWLIRPENPWFARAAVNRVWAWLLGRGIIHEPDDIRHDNSPAVPDLLPLLEKELVASKYDLKHICRLILNSQAYQRSSLPADAARAADSEALFGHYAVRRLDAEVLIDAICQITGLPESYSSQIPEPFTFIPGRQRTILLADGSITSPFLEMFGRPARDTGLFSERNNAITDAQRVHLLNSTHIRRKLENGWRLRNLINNAGNDRKALVEALYPAILSRRPTDEERETALQFFKSAGNAVRPAADDLAWALINSTEFLCRH